MQNNINSNHWRTTAGWSNFLRFRLFWIPNQLCYISRRWCSCMHYHVSCRQIANLSPEGAFRKLRNTPSGERSANGCCIYCFAPPPPPQKNVAIGIIILVILLIITTSLICVRWSQKRYSLTLGTSSGGVCVTIPTVSMPLCHTEWSVPWVYVQIATVPSFLSCKNVC